MPAYNAEQYIGLAVDSILSQSFKDFEFIIIDDGSSDNTHQIIASYSDPRIKYFRNEKNEGLTSVRNKLINRASSEFLAFLDSDDIADKNRLEKEYALFHSDCSLDIVSASASSIDHEGRSRKEAWSFDLSPAKLKAYLLFYNPIVTSTVMFRKSKLPEGGFRVGYPPCEDYDVWSRMLYHGKGVVLPDVLGVYRLHDSSVSKVQSEGALNNRNRVVLDQLEFYFPGQYSKDEADLHLSLVDFSIKDSKDDLKDLYAWIHRLLILNKSYKCFTEKDLHQVLYERVLKKMLRLKEYNLSVFSVLRQIRKLLNPDVDLELMKKELVILAFSIFRNKFIEF
jgi:glycosyltransferase involved in cell wall biosynthesis